MSETDRVIGRRTILLVEDDSTLRDVLLVILRRGGYHVLAAGDGASALALASTYGGSIDLLVSDVVMQGLSGPATWEQLLQDRPDVPVIFISGYDRDVIRRHGVPESGAVFMQKPVSASALLARVAEILGQPAPP
ncbi:MAG TPA: response regulator [Longimicrobiales bacterium]|nr:response regulator [Longimicrobiales bacterium]